MDDVIILAGGLGTRLSGTAPGTQKVMAEVAGQPFISYILENLYRNGYRRFVLAVSYHAEQIISFCKNAYQDARIVYSVENTPLGTGGALRQALSFCRTENVLLINGDTFFDVDYTKLNAAHDAKNSVITVAGKEMVNFDRYGTICFDENGIVSSFVEKKSVQRGIINGGVYRIRKDALPFPAAEKFSFEKEIMEKVLVRTVCVPMSGYFIDIGIPEDYARAQNEIPIFFSREDTV